MEDAVVYEKNAGTAFIRFNRPHRLNAINRALLKGLMTHLEASRTDDTVAAVILSGNERAFCAGEDLKETAAGKTLDQWIEEANALQDIQRLILRLGKPLIAAVSGYALGGGCEFAMGCDIRIAAENAVFGFPETGVGMTVTNAGTKLLTHLVGLGKAKELILIGDFINAREAERFGLVNRVVPTADLMKEAVHMAEKISKRSPVATRLSRIAIDKGMETGFEQILELEAAHLLVSAQTGKAYVEQRLKAMKKDGHGGEHGSQDVQ
jgi:enoyl-CoA hydratase/carnithine racemase